MGIYLAEFCLGCFVWPFETKTGCGDAFFPVSKNTTKKAKQSLRSLRRQVEDTLKIWSSTADRLESDANKSENPVMREALYLPAAIYRTCCVDLEGVLKGTVILSEEDAKEKMEAV